MADAAPDQRFSAPAGMGVRAPCSHKQNGTGPHRGIIERALAVRPHLSTVRQPSFKRGGRAWSDESLHGFRDRARFRTGDLSRMPPDYYAFPRRE